MRKLLSLFCLIAFLGVAMPAEAQLREDVVRSQEARAKLYGHEGPAFSLNRLFSPEHFKMSHSYEMSFGSFGGNSSSLGMYTNSMMFQFSEQVAARVDMSYAFSPFGSVNPLGPDAEQGRVFLRNAEIAYRPSESVQLHLQVRQSPFGSYMSPYGYGYGSYGYYPGTAALQAQFGSRVDDLFWKDSPH